jgi:hypothetical protein
MSALNAVLEIGISLKRKSIIVNYATDGSVINTLNQDYPS